MLVYVEPCDPGPMTGIYHVSTPRAWTIQLLSALQHCIVVALPIEDKSGHTFLLLRFCPFAPLMSSLGAGFGYE